VAAEEHRRTTRIPCRFPVRIVVPSDWPPATVLDLSRTGVRIGVELAALGVDRLACLGDIAARLEAILTLKIQVEFHPERLGSLVRRALKAVRIGRSAEDPKLVEIGCMLEPALTEEEALILGVPLPREGEPPDIARRRMAPDAPAPEPVEAPEPALAPAGSVPDGVPPPVRRVRAPGSYSASLVSRVRGQNRTLRGRTERLGPDGGVLWVIEEAERARASFPDNIAGRVVAFERLYGSDVDVSIESEGRYLWYGPVRITSVETVPELPGKLLLGFDFQRELASQEREALKLN
jgi:hypothetical protein